MSIFIFLGPSLAFIPLLHYECIGTHLIEENTGKEVHDPGLDPLDLFVSILRYLRQSSHTAPSLPFVQTDSVPSQPYLFCTNCSHFHVKPCIQKCPILWPLDACSAVHVWSVPLPQVFRATLQLSYPVGKYTYQSNTFSNKLGFFLWSSDGTG